MSNSLCPDLTARVLRFHPILWNNAIAMRIDVVASKNGKSSRVLVMLGFLKRFRRKFLDITLKGDSLPNLMFSAGLIPLALMLQRGGDHFVVCWSVEHLRDGDALTGFRNPTFELDSLVDPTSLLTMFFSIKLIL